MSARDRTKPRCSSTHCAMHFTSFGWPLALARRVPRVPPLHMGCIDANLFDISARSFSKYTDTISPNNWQLLPPCKLYVGLVRGVSAGGLDIVRIDDCAHRHLALTLPRPASLSHCQAPHRSHTAKPRIVPSLYTTRRDTTSRSVRLHRSCSRYPGRCGTPGLCEGAAAQRPRRGRWWWRLRWWWQRRRWWRYRRQERRRERAVDRGSHRHILLCTSTAFHFFTRQFE